MSGIQVVVLKLEICSLGELCGWKGTPEGNMEVVCLEHILLYVSFVFNCPCIGIFCLSLASFNKARQESISLGAVRLVSTLSGLRGWWWEPLVHSQ